MSLASGGSQWGRDVQREMDGWSEDQRRWDAKEREYKTEALTCRFGGDCRQGLNCPYWHSDEETGIFVDERELRTRKLMIRCGFCARGECRFEGCCARALRTAAAKASADSDYESNSGADNARGDSALSSDGDRGEDDGWETQSSGGGSSLVDCWSGGDCCSDEGRFAALGAERREEDSVRGALRPAG